MRRPVTLREVLTFTPPRATSHRYTWTVRRRELLAWWWRRVNALPHGDALVAAYEHLVYDPDRWMAHRFGWHSIGCRGRGECAPPPGTRNTQTGRRWYRWRA